MLAPELFLKFFLGKFYHKVKMPFQRLLVSIYMDILQFEIKVNSFLRPKKYVLPYHAAIIDAT